MTPESPIDATNGARNCSPFITWTGRTVNAPRRDAWGLKAHSKPMRTPTMPPPELRAGSSFQRAGEAQDASAASMRRSFSMGAPGVTTTPRLPPTVRCPVYPKRFA